MIVPCFNEEKRFPTEYWRNITTNTNVQWYFVDDGSTDGTLTVLKTLECKNVNILQLKENSGKSEAIRLGYLRAKQDHKNGFGLIGYIDCDGAFELKDINRIIEMAKVNQRYSMIWSSRVMLAGSEIVRSNIRHYLGRMINTYIWAGISPKIYDTQSGFKVFKHKPYFHEIMLEKFETKWFVDLEIYTRCLNFENSLQLVQEAPLESWKEISGSKIKISMTPMILREIILIKRKLKRGLKNGS